MGLGDRLKDLTKKAEATAAEHKDQIHQVVQKAGVAADQRTGGRYHEQIVQAGAKAGTFIEGLKDGAGPNLADSRATGTADDVTPPRPCRDQGVDEH